MRPLIVAAALIAAVQTPSHAADFWENYRSNPSTGVLNSCKLASPAKAFADVSAMGFFPRYEERDGGDEVIVVWVDGQEVALSFFRSLASCQKRAQVHIDNANKYR